jgi:hypothetical protein
MPAKFGYSPALFLLCFAAFGQAPRAPVEQAMNAARSQAGVVVLIDGTARAESAGSAPRALKVGDTVNEGDILTSSPNGELHLKMQDSGFMVLRPNSRFEIVTYRADGGDEDKGIFNLISGKVRSITGWMGRHNAQSYTLRAGTVTIGIRGTDHETSYVPEGSTEGEPGVYDRVYAGGTVISGTAGEASVAPNQAGFQPLRQGGKPRLLASIPGFFRPGPHEAQIEKKHAEIQQHLEQQREERRKVVAQKRAELGASREKAKEIFKDNKAAESESRQSARAQREETKAQVEALKKDAQDASALRADVTQERKALGEAVRTGQITRPELRERRAALKEKEERLKQAQESIDQRRKALQETGDAKIDERYNAAQERLKAMHDQQLDARAKRQSLEDERKSAADEAKSQQQQENRRYGEELKADRKGSAPTSP